MIDASDDAYLVGQDLEGTIRACDFQSGSVLIQLNRRLDYKGHYLARDLEVVMSVPVLRFHGPGRLLFTWSAVRVVDAPSFRAAGQGFSNTIATGRLVLGAGSHLTLHRG